MDKRNTGSGVLRLAVVAGTLLLSACSFSSRDSGPSRAMDFSHLPDAVPKHEKRTRAGNPKTYVVLGKRYYVKKSSRGYRERGIASWYGKKFHGRKTSNGEIYNMYAMTAAHKTLPIPTYLQVTNLKNGKQVVVRVNDRGPFHENRIIDLSYAAASKLGITASGTGMVELRAIEPGEPTTTPTRLADSAPAPAVSPPPAEALSARLYLQLGSFISRNNAESLRARLALNNVIGAAVEQSTVDRRPIYRVRIGPLNSVEEADRLALRIDRLGIGIPSIVID
jgi:rare lipoprotein A